MVSKQCCIVKMSWYEKLPLNLLGVTSILGGEVAKGAIRYTNTFWARRLTGFIVVPGLYSISAQMLKRSNDNMAMICSPGEREDRRKIVGFQSLGMYKYSGTHSGTNASVANALCEGWLNRKWTLVTPKKSKLYLEDGTGKKTSVLISNIRCSKQQQEIELSGPDENKFIWYSLIPQMCTFATLALMVTNRDYPGMLISAANMTSYFLMINAITSDVFKIPKATPAPGSPPGNSIVTDKRGGRICAMNGHERDIQSFMQNPVDIDERKNRIFFNEAIVPILGYATAIATILFTPKIQTQGLFAVQLFSGLLSGLVFSSRDGDAMLEKIADKYYSEDGDNGIDTTKVSYTNRATAVAAAIFVTGGRIGHLDSTLVPEYDKENNWQKYRRLVDSVAQERDANVYPNTASELQKCKNVESAIYLFCKRFPDSAGLLYGIGEHTSADEKFCEKLHAYFSKDDANKLRVRLIVDVVEATVDNDNIDVSWKRVFLDGNRV